MVPITWDKIGMKNLTKRSFFSTSTKTVPIKASGVIENGIIKESGVTQMQNA